MCRARPRITAASLRRCLILSFLLIPTSLFDQRDHLFVPTCLFQERRAQRKARLARQGHRRRRCRSEHGARLPRVGIDLHPVWRTPLLAHAAKAVTSNWAGLR